MLIAGQTKDLMAAVHLASDGSQVSTLTILAIIRLESFDADDGKFWDNTAWVVSPAPFPTAIHIEAGQWLYELPAAATAGKVGATVHFTFTDDTDETQATTVCGGAEHFVRSDVPSALDVADAVWDEILAGHTSAGSTGEALDALAQGLVGARQVTIHVDDNQGTPQPVPGVLVSVFAEDNLTFLTRGVTDSNGDFTVALDDNTYQVRLQKTQFTFTVPETMVVTADATFTFTATDFVLPPPPSAPDRCVIFGFAVQDAGGEVVAGADVDAFATTPQIVAGSQMAKRIANTKTDSNGDFNLELVRNTEVRFVIEAADVDFVKTVPDLASQDVTTWP